MRYLLASMPLALMPAVNAAQDASNESLGAVWVSKALAEMSVLMGVPQIPQHIEGIYVALLCLLAIVIWKAAERFGGRLGDAIWDKPHSIWAHLRGQKPDETEPSRDPLLTRAIPPQNPNFTGRDTILR